MTVRSVYPIIEIGRKARRKAKTMSPQTTNETQLGGNTKTVTTSVFDLASFDTVKLSKVITLPSKPASIEEALAAVGNDSQKLLDVIYEGLAADAVETARNDMSGFLIADDDDEEKNGKPYEGKYADEDMSDKINKAVLSMAKVFGFDKSLSKEKKREVKEQAREMLRSNPAFIASISK